MFTRKTFKATAEIISGMNEGIDKCTVAGKFAKFFAEDNPNFKRDCFLDACGVNKRPVRVTVI